MLCTWLEFHFLSEYGLLLSEMGSVPLPLSEEQDEKRNVRMAEKKDRDRGDGGLGETRYG